MKRFILIAAVFCMLSVSAFAKDALKVDISIDNDFIKGTVSVDGAGASKPISIRVLDENGTYNFADVIYTNKSGEASFEYVNSGTTGTYNFTAYSPEKNEKADVVFKFFDSDYRIVMINEFNQMLTDRSSASEYVEKYAQALDITGYYSEIGSSAGFDSTILSAPGEAAEVKDINKMLNDAVLLSLINEKHNGELLKRMFTDEKFEEYLKFITGNGGESILNSLSDDIRNSFYTYVANGSYTTAGQLLEAEKNILLTQGIKNASLAAETKMLIEAYKNKGWLNLSESQDMDRACGYLTGKSYIDLRAVEEAYNNYKEESGNTNPGGGSSGGGSSGGGSKSSSVIAFNPPLINENVTEKEQLFSDVELTMWAEKAIRKCVESGILTGMGDETFNPSGKLTRAQAAVIICKLAKLSESGKDFGYNDVNSGDWYAGYVNAVTEAGLFYGIGENEFGVNGTLTREQAAAIFWRYLEKNGASAGENRYVFEDDDKISDWAKEAVRALVGLGIISGKTDKLFAPEQPLLRSEAAVILSNILDYVNRD